MTTVISVENLSKVYRLGQIGSGTFANDLKLWWAKTRGKPNPLLGIGESDHGNQDGENLWALKDVSFTVKQGEVLGIIGRNGAGKSTLLKILSRVTAPTSGRVRVKGRIASLLEVGTGFHPELTGRENTYLNGAILGMSRHEIDRKFDEIVDFSGVEKFIDTPVKRYSSGMYVRLAFAVAAHLEPEILVVDEVLAVGDAEFQKKCLGKMGDVAKEGRTVLFVSHNMGAISRLCQRVILISRGIAGFDGSSELGVMKYLMASASSVERKIIYVDNPNLPIVIREISVSANGKFAHDILDISDQLSVGLVYQVKEDIKGTNISVSLLRDGVALFRSWDIDKNQQVFDIRKKGTYHARIALPERLLSPGYYTITVSAGRPGVGVIDKHEDCIAFELENYSTDTTHKSLSRGGLISIPLFWDVHKLNEKIL